MKKKCHLINRILCFRLLAIYLQSFPTWLRQIALYIKTVSLPFREFKSSKPPAHWSSSPIFCVMPWMSWATSSCPEAMRAFSWLRRSRLSVSELSICSWPSYSFPCWARRASWPFSTLSREAVVSSFSSSWPSFNRPTAWKTKQNETLCFIVRERKKRRFIPSGPSSSPAGLWRSRWANWQWAQLYVGRAAGELRSRQNALCCWWCDKHSKCPCPCCGCTLSVSERWRTVAQSVS